MKNVPSAKKKFRKKNKDAIYLNGGAQKFETNEMKRKKYEFRCHFAEAKFYTCKKR